MPIWRKVMIKGNDMAVSGLLPELIAPAEARGCETDIWKTARELLAELEAQVGEEGGD